MNPYWHEGDLAGVLTFGPVGWSIDLGSAAAQKAMASAPPLPGDLADARTPQALARRQLVRALVARMADCHPDHVQLGRSPHGAPVVIAPDGWFVSVSGRENRCFIGAARVPIGVDMEAVTAGEPLWDMLTPAEAEAVRALPADTRHAEWLRRWCAKEAHAKLIGEPRRIDPAQIATQPEGERLFCDFEGRSCCWTLQSAGRWEALTLWLD